MSAGWQARFAWRHRARAVAQKYTPDYVSEKQYDEILNANKACMALHNAARQAHADALGAVTMQFYRGKDEAALALLGRHGRSEPRPRKGRRSIGCTTHLPRWPIRPIDRTKLASPRWQVEFDLAMGRLLAAKVRIDGYNAQLAVIKQGKAFANASSSLWMLRQANTNAAGSALEKMIRRFA